MPTLKKIAINESGKIEIRTPLRAHAHNVLLFHNVNWLWNIRYICVNQ